MTPTMLRQLWTIVETTQSNTLLKLDDTSLVQWLLQQTTTQAPLERNDTHVLSDYIHSRLTLIRDLAQERQCSWEQN